MVPEDIFEFPDEEVAERSYMRDAAKEIKDIDAASVGHDI